MTRIITVEVSPSGEVKAEAFGYSGPACAEAVKSLLRDFKAGEESHKAEFYEAGVAQQQHIGGVP